MLSDHQMRRTSNYDRRAYMGDDLLERTVGIIGLGNVGARVAELCRGLFRMRVIAFDPYLSADQVAARGPRRRRRSMTCCGRPTMSPSTARIPRKPAA
jgi:D-3-phosphoglycerate dehydrogenase